MKEVSGSEGARASGGGGGGSGGGGSGGRTGKRHKSGTGEKKRLTRTGRQKRQHEREEKRQQGREVWTATGVARLCAHHAKVFSLRRLVLQRLGTVSIERVFGVIGKVRGMC